MAKKKAADFRPVSELLEKYARMKPAIEQRLAEFSLAGKGSDEDVYAEMCFCMLTPQSKALSCWKAVEELRKKGLLFSDDVDGIKNILKTKVRFHNNKAQYIVNNKKIFPGGKGVDGKAIDIKGRLSEFGDAEEIRSWLAANVEGFGWKEASHFLRNIGLCGDIAILDRHVLWNLRRYGIIQEIPRSLTPKKYMEIEGMMREFCKSSGIPMPHLDLLFWAAETGEIFK